MIPLPSLKRLCRLHRFLEEYSDLPGGDRDFIDSSELAFLTGIPAHTIRKDISLLKCSFTGGKQGYSRGNLKRCIGASLLAEEPLSACIVGLGTLGAALTGSKSFIPDGFRLAAGFDGNINRIELLKTSIPLYPLYDLERIVAEMGITLCIVTVPPENVRTLCDRLYACGIKGVLNFTPVYIRPMPGLFVRNISATDEFKILAAMIYETQKEEKHHVQSV